MQSHLKIVYTHSRYSSQPYQCCHVLPHTSRHSQRYEKCFQMISEKFVVLVKAPVVVKVYSGCSGSCLHQQTVTQSGSHTLTA